MWSVTIPLLLLYAQVVGLNSIQSLNATVGGSVLIPCPLPNESPSLSWFYWQEVHSKDLLFHWDTSGKTQKIDEKYINRSQAFKTEFSSGNISIRLDNVTVGDDQKTFYAFAWLTDVQNKPIKNFEKLCESKLQVSAPFKDLVVRVNKTANTSTCTAHGGYPEPHVSWTGLNKSSATPMDLPDAETSLQLDPEKTFSVTSSVSVKELQSVTCLVFNPRTRRSITGTEEIEASGEDNQRQHLAIGITVALGVVAFAVLLYMGVRRQCQPDESRPAVLGLQQGS